MRSSVRSLSFVVLFLLVPLVLSAQQPSPAEERHSDHEELRAMLRTATDALNKRDVNALAPIVASRCYITTVDGQTFRDLAGFKSYIDKLYDSSVSKIEFHPVADDLTTFLDDYSGICAGSSSDNYSFKDGGNRTMTSRWTATVHKQDGRWKLVGLHTSANVLSNPVVDATKQKGYAISGAAVILGLVAGYVLRSAMKRS